MSFIKYLIILFLAQNIDKLRWWIVTRNINNHNPTECSCYSFLLIQDEFEDAEGVIRISKSKEDNTMAKRKRTKWQTTIYKTNTQKTKDRATQTR